MMYRLGWGLAADPTCVLHGGSKRSSNGFHSDGDPTEFPMKFDASCVGCICLSGDGFLMVGGSFSWWVEMPFDRYTGDLLDSLNAKGSFLGNSICWKWKRFACAD